MGRIKKDPLDKKPVKCCGDCVNCDKFLTSVYGVEPLVEIQERMGPDRHILSLDQIIAKGYQI